MRFTFLAVLAAASIATVSAQSSLDLVSQAELHRIRLEQKQTLEQSKKVNKLLKRESGSATTHVLGIIRLANGTDSKSLENEGVSVLGSRHGFAFVAMPVEDVERVASLKCVSRFQIAREVSVNNNLAREASGVNKIHSGEDLDQAYTGAGIIAGVVDVGMDPNHINFRNDDGTSRVKFLASSSINSSTSNPISTRFYNDTNIKNFETDDATTYHGSHTLGTMAGGYKGLVTYAVDNNDAEKTASTVEGANPYYGIAYGSDIAIATGPLYDAVIAYGVDYILQYASEVGKRAVINLSIGSNMGPHDGNSLINQYLDACAKQDNAIICMSSGNEGDMKIALNKTLTATDNTCKTFVIGGEQMLQDGSKVFARAGQTAIYSDTEKPFTLSMVVYNKKRSRNARIFQMADPTDASNNGVGKYWISSEDQRQSSTDIKDLQFGTYFDGYVGCGWSYNEDSGRFYCLVDYYLINTTSNADDNYTFGFIATGEEGQRLDVFCDGTYATLGSQGIEGWDDASTNGSISDMCTGYSVLAVGSYNTRNDFPALDGLCYHSTETFTPGKISGFTSYGTLIDGRNMPDVCAPGAIIISSTNSYYVDAVAEAYGEATRNQNQAKVSEADRDNYWYWAIGTSMASPYVAGSLALWVEADPNITIDDVKDIIKATAIRDNDVLTVDDPIRAGAGKFDAYAGLKEVIRRAGVGTINADADSRLMVKALGGKQYEVFVNGADNLNVTLCDISGKTAFADTFSGDEAVMNLSSLAPGIYVMNVNRRYTQKIIIK